MLGARPKLGAPFLPRPRLLERLPEEPGHVVWLHAPYGYGKSILAAQWAAQLEALSWRVLWLSAPREVEGRVAAAVGLPAGVPWDTLLDALWQQPTLLVLEDLETGAGLSPLLGRVEGLLLLASRGPLHSPELLKLLTSGRVTELGAQDLAFGHAEAAALIHDPGRREEALELSQGWPLPLHFTALTGRAPEPQALLAGIRESVSPKAWCEVLFLAALPQLPDGSATAATAQLAGAGFVQHLENGFRLHPLTAEAVLDAYPEEVRAVVRAEAGRLPPPLQGAAFETAGLLSDLAALLEDRTVDLARYDAEAVLRWDRRVPPPRGTVRTQRVGYALSALGRTHEGVQLILSGAASEGSSERKLNLYTDAVWWLAVGSRFEEAVGVAELAQPHLDRADPETAGRFLTNGAYIYFAQGDWARAEAGYALALDYFPEAGEGSQRYLAETNLGIVRWHRVGDLSGLAHARHKALQHNRRQSPQNVVGDLLQLGELELLLGHRERARQLFREAQPFAKAHPSFALIADGRRALVEGEVTAFPALWDRASGWDDPQIRDRVLVSWVACLREQGRPDEGLRVSEGHRGPWTDPQRALALHELSRTDDALALLGDAPPPSRLMEERLYWHAAKFQLTLNPADLDTLLGMTLASARVLPGLVPLEKLPRDRPELAAPYPLEAVLASGWKGAVEHRLGELPPLELTLLGGFKATRMGETLNLTGRHQELLTLMVLGLSKDAIGEAIWPEAEPKKVKNNLYVTLNALRKLLEPWGVPTYLTTHTDDLGLTRTHTDLGRLEAALGAGDAQAVLGHYRGPLTPQLDLSEIAEAREALHERVVDALYQAGRDDPSWQAEAVLRRAVDLDPFHEAALQALLRRLVARGRRAEAVRLYRSFACRLEAELQAAPDRSTGAIVGL